METALEYYVDQVQQSLNASTALQDQHARCLEEEVPEHFKVVQKRRLPLR